MIKKKHKPAPAKVPVDPDDEFDFGHERSVDVRALLDQLNFSPEDVPNAASVQPGLFLDAARYRVQLMRRRVEAESRRDRIRAEVALELRNNATLMGVRMTEGNLQENLLVNPTVVRAEEEYNRMTEAEEFSKLLLEAFRHRRDSFSVVGTLTGAERAMARIIEVSSNQTASMREKLKQRYPGAS